ncbi:KaiC domain-containing protein [Halobacteriales archaeon SW_7_68_16]|nr:MAG: KaiC domain-containing protein [Halobacteriales archaeon SW_7_68_16]
MSEEEDWFERAVEDLDTDGMDGDTSEDGEDDDHEAADAGVEGAASDGGGIVEDAPAADEGPFGSGPDGVEDDIGEFSDDEVFDQDFATALGDDGSGGGGDEEFGDDIDTDIPRLKLGIDGLDAMIGGGVPERSLMVTIGSAGTGKTTFGVQFLNRALKSGESAVFVALEESRDRVIDSAVEKGFPFDEYIDDDRLAVVDIDPVDMASSLGSVGSELPQLVEEFGATRAVLDSVSILEMMYDDRATRRNEIYEFTRSLKDAGVTTLLTSEASEDSAYASRYGIVEYLTDAVFVLQYVRPSDFRETRLAVEIQKIRDANHSRETKPYEITDAGISVYRQANIF